MGAASRKLGVMSSRRKFLGLMGGAAAAGCAGRAAPNVARASAPRPAIRAVAFDLFTLFDPRGIDQRVSEVLGPIPGFAATWKTRLFEYSWLRAASSQYRDFEGLARDALTYAARAHGLELSSAARTRLECALTELEPWPDSAETLDSLRTRGLSLAPLANFSPRMIERLIGRAGMTFRFQAFISSDQARSYKPDPRAYALAEKTFGLPRQQIAFVAFGGWDAAGARWFGFPTFWVNRLAQPSEELADIEASGPDLGSLARWLASSGPAVTVSAG